MTQFSRYSRLVLAASLGLAAAACTSMNKPLSKSFGVATQANMEAQIVPMDDVETGPTASSAERADKAREKYNSGEASSSVKTGGSTKQ